MLRHKFFVLITAAVIEIKILAKAYASLALVAFLFGFVIFASSESTAQTNDEENLIEEEQEAPLEKQAEDQSPLTAIIVPGFVDIPMHPELSYKPEDVTIFDSAEGIVHETRTFSMTADKDDIINFYLENLPPLGWVFSARTEEKLEFLRDKDFLWIGVYLGKNGGLIVDFFQVPDTFTNDDLSLP